MKKRLLLMLAFVMVLTVLSGCGGSTAPAPAGETGEKVQENKKSFGQKIEDFFSK